MTRRLLFVAIAVAAMAHSAGAQPTFALKPASSNYVVAKEVAYGKADTLTLRMDVYKPSDAGRRRYPALIIFNRALGSASRSQPFTVGWGYAAATRGVVTILPDLRSGSEAADFRSLLTYLAARGPELGIDPEAIAVYAASGNVYTAFPVVEDPTMTAVKAAIMYYGGAPITEFRRDLPVLYVRAGLDLM